MTRRSGLFGRAATSLFSLGVALIAPTQGALAAAGPSVVHTGSAPPSSYACRMNTAIDAIEGAHASASAIGWAGNFEGVVTCLGGSFYIQDNLNESITFGIYHGGSTTWVDADGYLPAQITSFHSDGVAVHITEFADRIVVGATPYVAVYCRVAIDNRSARPIVADPDPSPQLVDLASAPDHVGAHATAVHDYVIAADRFGTFAPWPSAQQLAAAGSFDEHFAHMRAFWNDQLSQIAQIEVPDPSLDDAYRSGFITTQIARSGTHLDTGVNGYDAEFSHDVVGILANLFTQGDDTDAHALLLEARNVVGAAGAYDDGLWTYSWPWAIYLIKTGDLSFVKANFSTPGPGGSAPSIEQAAHDIAADRTGPGAIMGMTDDIDSNGYWTIDDYEALMGLAAYSYLAGRVGDTGEAEWALEEYASLLAATNRTLTSTITQHHLDYLPCSMVQANTADRCKNPEDANWAAPFLFGRWAWDAQLLGAPVDGPGLDLIDATYDYGFGRLKGTLPAGTYGGYPGDYYSSAYDAGYGEWGLASRHHRSEGILGYQFMVANTQSGPFSWWESDSAPDASSWVGSHPSSGQGSSPHAWGMADANLVLLDSLAAQESNGDLIVGRGVPSSWLRPGNTIAVSNFPTTNGARIGIRISSTGTAVHLRITGKTNGAVLFELPVFVHNIGTVTGGTIDQGTGSVRLPPGTRTVGVRLRRAA